MQSSPCVSTSWSCQTWRTTQHPTTTSTTSISTSPISYKLSELSRKLILWNVFLKRPIGYINKINIFNLRKMYLWFHDLIDKTEDTHPNKLWEKLILIAIYLTQHSCPKLLNSNFAWINIPVSVSQSITTLWPKLLYTKDTRKGPDTVRSLSAGQQAQRKIF